MPRYGIVCDVNRCVGCMTCVINCKEENLTRPGIWWNQILQVENTEAKRIMYVRYACMHCEDPPCVKACPNHAIYQRQDGIVLVNKEKCSGVGDCVDACPYEVIMMTPDKQYFTNNQALYDHSPAEHRVHPPGKASMCTLCYHRIDQGLEPSCVVGCPSKAMIFGDLDDPDSPIQKYDDSEPLQAGAGTRPKVTYRFPDGQKDYVEEAVMQNPHMPK
ncbi:MAG: 4Fe-4S dicluster domain-containing protein [Desulfuromusa sp.]|nr:4Fe-4S dicluster domain-containing protein [Desulfuromusa sp.]